MLGADGWKVRSRGAEEEREREGEREVVCQVRMGGMCSALLSDGRMLGADGWKVGRERQRGTRREREGGGGKREREGGRERMGSSGEILGSWRRDVESRGYDEAGGWD